MKKNETAPEGWDVPAHVAIPRLLEAHGGRLYGLALRLCGTPEEAEDLVQETFLLAFRRWGQFERRSSPFTWLYTIASRVCQRFHRRRSGEPARLERLDELLPFGAARIGVVPADGEDGAGAQVRREGAERVRAAIAALPVKFRMPLVLKDLAGFSVAEVAAILGLVEATVKTRVHRARLKVRAALEHALPRRELPPPAYSKRICLDLLRAKQESLDRGVPMPNAKEIICDRCRAVFATMDLTGDLCREIGDQPLPDELRRLLLEEVGAADAGNTTSRSG